MAKIFLTISLSVFLKNFGSLIDFETGKFHPLYDPTAIIIDPWIPHRIWDSKQREWRQLALMDIPNTYTYVQRPTNFVEESRLYMAFAGLVNHRFIWARDEIPRNEFACLASRVARENYRRFCVFDF